jgi:hypothetical protein
LQLINIIIINDYHFPYGALSLVYLL